MLQRRQTLVYVVILITTVILANHGHYGYAVPDLHLGNLGTVISDSVARQMSGLTTQLNRQLVGLDRHLQTQLSKLSSELQMNMHDITQNVQANFHDLSQTIKTRVRQSLAPVNALMVKSAMAQGIGGTTVVVYGGEIQHIIIDGNAYTCAGDMVKEPHSAAGVRCTTNLEFHPPNDHTDVCTDSKYSRVYNLYCFGNYASLVCVDNTCQCRGGAMHTLDHLRGVCGPEYGTGEYVKYDYYPNLQNANRIPVPHPNKYVRCENSGETHCVWHGNGFVMPASDYIANL